jgi:hypothetical protein
MQGPQQEQRAGDDNEPRQDSKIHESLRFLRTTGTGRESKNAGSTAGSRTVWGIFLISISASFREASHAQRHIRQAAGPAIVVWMFAYIVGRRANRRRPREQGHYSKSLNQISEIVPEPQSPLAG